MNPDAPAAHPAGGLNGEECARLGESSMNQNAPPAHPAGGLNGEECARLGESSMNQNAPPAHPAGGLNGEEYARLGESSLNPNARAAHPAGGLNGEEYARLAVGTVFNDFDAFVTCAREVAARVGFAIIIRNSKRETTPPGEQRGQVVAMRLHCSRDSQRRKANNDAIAPHMQRKCASIKSGCKFFIYAKIGVPHGAITDPASRCCYILNANYNHCNGCEPDKSQMIAAKNAGGHYIKMIPNDVWATLHILHQARSSTSQVRAYLRANHIFPEAVPLDSLRITNIMKMCAKRAQQGDLSLDSQSHHEFFEALDNEPISGLSDADLQQHLLQNMQGGDGPGGGWRLFNLLNDIKNADEGFDFRVALDDQQQPIGVCWQSGTQRADFINFGQFIALDCCKKKLNNYGWPYFAPCGYTGDNTLAVFAQAICISELKNSYTFVLNSLFEMSGVACRERCVNSHNSLLHYN
jgi:hypothetical protein